MNFSYLSKNDNKLLKIYTKVKLIVNLPSRDKTCSFWPFSVFHSVRDPDCPLLTINFSSGLKAIDQFSPL